MQERLGRVDELMIKAVGPMAGGSRMGSLCGALQAGILTVESFQPVKQFYQEFEDAFGSRFCPEIIRADLDVPEERKQWVDRGGKRECAELCGRTVRILFGIIGEKKP
jgi:hypothetical protein